jgi:hypothetical protein
MSESSTSSVINNSQNQCRLQSRIDSIEESKQYYTKLSDIPDIHSSLYYTYYSGITIPISFRLTQLKNLQKMIEINEKEIGEALVKDLNRFNFDF